MAVEFRDYYSVLAVPRDASPDAIKQAFRKLARKYHPDVAKDKKTAEEKFKEINEAHEVLSDPAKRRKYDELGADWETGGARAAPPPQARRTWSPSGGMPREEYHFGGTGFSDFFEQFFGGGRGSVDVDDLFRQARGNGQGPAGDHHAVRGQDIEGDILVTLDEVLQGAMRTLTLEKSDPRSGGRKVDTFQVRIPPGAQDGRRIRVPAKGGEGRGGGPAGDLFLRVRLAAHPEFEVRGSDLYHDLTLAPWEAVLGTQILVPTLSGRLRLRIPAGTTAGRQLRVKGQGLPVKPGGERGDLYVVTRIDIPTEINGAERDLWAKLAEVSRFDPRPGGG